MFNRLNSLNCVALIVALLATSLFFTDSASAQNRLKVGGAAPGLDIKKWFNGPAVTIQPGKTYIVEFWATWCAPCKRSIPHLNELHKKYASKGLVMIGVSDEKEDVVEGFLQSWSDRMTYLVAVDRDKATSRAWMEASGQKGIPCAFVVDRAGKVVHIGNPLDSNFDRIVLATLLGKYDPKKEAAAAPALAAADRAIQYRNWRDAYKHMDEVVALDPSLFSDVARRRFETMMVEEKNEAGAYAYARTLLDLHSNDPLSLGLMGVDIASNPKYADSSRNYDLALEFAEAARRGAGERNPAALHVLALVQFHRGEFEEAVENQMQAWMIAEPADKAEFRRALDRYRGAAEKAAASAK